jgi:nitroreductase/NAD-dependent dihydropyrimidine dehydrogenase PreA subunit
VGFVIDLELCKKDGFCSQVCPAEIISMDGPQGSPAPVEDFEEVCLHCGHCLAVCPHGALTLEGVAPGDCPPIAKDLKIRPDQARQFLLGRRSIRRYKDKELERGQLEEILDIARQAPSGHNSQPVEWLVFSGREKVKEIAELVADWMGWMVQNMPEIALPLHMDRTLARFRAGGDPLMRGAPYLMVTHAHKDNGFAQSSSTIALTYVDLACYSLGLGACWAGYFYRAALAFPAMQQFLDLPEDHITYGAMFLGYAKYKYPRIPPRNPARVTWR